MHTISEPHYDTEILKYHHFSPFPPSLTTKNIDYADFLEEEKSLCQCPTQYHILFT